MPSFTLVLPSPSSSLKCRSLLRSRPCCSSRALLSPRLIGRVAPTTHGNGYETHNGCLSSDFLSTTDEARASRRTTHSTRMPVESPHICNLHAGRVVSVSPSRGMSITIYHMMISRSVYRSSTPTGIRVLGPDRSQWQRLVQMQHRYVFPLKRMWRMPGRGLDLVRLIISFSVPHYDSAIPSWSEWAYNCTKVLPPST